MEHDIANLLSGHAFETLFIETLGWDRCSGRMTLEADGQKFEFITIAHKRGFRVIHCSTHRYTLMNRARLRRLQKMVRKVAHEHILIYSSEEPRKQVWQWAIERPGLQGLLHREHPFFSQAVPNALVARLSEMAFSLGEEEGVTLGDALMRVREALDTRAELNLFAKHPTLSEAIDRAARAMRAGGTKELQDFIMMNARLAQKPAKSLSKRLGIDIEDAEQIEMIAIILAARRFRPELGFQFSTYAMKTIQRAEHRLGPVECQLVRVRSDIFWKCRTIQRLAERLDARSGTGRGYRFLRWWMIRRPKPGGRFRLFQRATGVRTCCDPREPECAAAKQLVCRDAGPLEGLLLSELPEHVDRALQTLDPVHQMILRMRHGIGAEESTLEAIGTVVGLTKERVRQIQVKAEKHLANLLTPKLGDMWDEENLEREKRKELEESPPVEPVQSKSGRDALSPPPIPSLQEEAPEVFVLRQGGRSVQKGLFVQGD